MPDLFQICAKWWKQILVFMVISAGAVAAVLWLQPALYLSVATAVPASSYAADKGSVFNRASQLLYPANGTPDDLDLIVGTAQLDTVYLAVSAQLNLPDHYRVEEKDQAAIEKSAYLLKKNTKVFKSDFGELKVKVWDRDKQVAAEMANAILDRLQTIHQDLQNSRNLSVIHSLERGLQQLQREADSVNNRIRTADSWAPSPAEDARYKSIVEQAGQYQGLLGEYRVMAAAKPPVLNLVEKARPANWPDKPKKLPTLAATLFFSLLFAILAVLVIERRKQAAA